MKKGLILAIIGTSSICFGDRFTTEGDRQIELLQEISTKIDKMTHQLLLVNAHFVMLLDDVDFIGKVANEYSSDFTEDRD